MCMRETDRQRQRENVCMCMRESEREGSAFANILPSTGHENDIFQPKQVSVLVVHLIFHRLSAVL